MAHNKQTILSRVTIQLFVQLLMVVLYPLEACSQFAFAASLLKVRQGWRQTATRIQKGLPVKIAYFGGSITYAKDGWREQTLAGLQAQYPQVVFSHINAGVGGTGSDLGVFRINKDVLSHNPDLVLVEFAVNDANKPPGFIKECMEGIVTKIRQQRRKADIGFLYTIEKNMLSFLEAGQMPPSIAAMEEVADYYGLPSVFLADNVVKNYREGRLLFAGDAPLRGDTMVFSKDGVHPFPQTGHRLYAAAFLEALPQLFAVASNPKKIKKPLTQNRLQQAQIISLADVSFSSHWQLLTAAKDSIFRTFVNRFDTLLATADTAAAISFSFTGNRFGLYDLIGPGSGAYTLTIDGTDTIIVRFDRFCTYWRKHYFLSPSLPEGLHTVVIRPSSAVIEKETILRRPLTDAEKPLYEKRAVYPGRLLLSGTLVSIKKEGR